MESKPGKPSANNQAYICNTQRASQRPPARSLAMDDVLLTLRTLSNVGRQRSLDSNMKEQIKSIIITEVQENLSSLTQVKLDIEHHFKKSLSAIDEVYIQRKYNKYCSERWLKIILTMIKEIMISENHDLIVEMIGQLNNMKSLEDVPKLFNQSKSFYILTDYRVITQQLYLLSKEEEDQFIAKIKHDSLSMIMDCCESTKNEIQFLINMTDLLSSTKHLEFFIDHFRLKKVSSKNYSSKRFNRCLKKIIEIDGNDPDYDDSDSDCDYYLQEYYNISNSDYNDFKNDAKFKSLRESAILLYHCEIRMLKTICESIASYIKPPEIRKVHVDNRFIIEVIGKNISISKVLRKIEKMLERDENIEEARIIGSTIHADADFEQNIWHGKNIVVLANALNVHKKIVWNVSGLDNLHIYEEGARRDSEGNGLDGADGFPGESGGNVLIESQVISNPEYLTIISNGGKGSKGQDGGNGRDGTDGKGITTTEFDRNYPLTASVECCRKNNIKKTVEVIRNEFELSTEWYKNEYTYYNNTINEILDDCAANDCFDGNIYLEGKSAEGTAIVFSFERGGWTTNCQSFLLFTGSEGKPGGNGGEFGLGGEGGYSGDIVIRSSGASTLNNRVIRINGENGSNGQGGKFGKHGINGCDMAYQDYSISSIFNDSWPKYYGRDESSKLSLEYYSSNSNRRIRCSYREPLSSIYAEINSRRIENQSQKTYLERVTTRQNNNRKSYAKAVRQKSVSLNVVKHYSHLLNDNFSNDLISKVYNKDYIKSLILSSIQETSSAKKIPKIEMSIKRQINYSPHNSNRVDSTITNAIHVENKSGNQRIETIVKSSVVNWIYLKQIELSLTQTNKFLDVLPKWSKESADFHKMFGFEIGKFLIHKYRINILNEITKHNFDNISFPSNIDKDDAVDNVRYLKETNREILRNYHHPILGSFAQFLVTPFDITAQEKISKFCTEELNIKSENLQQILRTFVLETGCGIKVCHKVKCLYDKYEELFKQLDDGNTVPPERFEELDSNCLQKSIFDEWIGHMKEKSPLSISYREFLAVVFNINLRIYFEEDGHFQLQSNHNAVSTRIVHVVFRYNQFIPLTIDEDLKKLEKKRRATDEICGKILKAVESINTKVELDTFLKAFSVKKFGTKTMQEEDHVEVRENITCQHTKLLHAISSVFAPGEQREIKERLDKIKFTTQKNFIFYLSNRFAYEGCHVSCQEVLQIVNAILASHINDRNESNTYTWLIASHLQKDWIKELVIINIENYFKKSISEKDEFRTQLRGINNNVLVILNAKLTDNLNINLNFESIKDTLYLLSKTHNEPVSLETLQLSEWPFALKEAYFKCSLKNMFNNWTNAELEIASYYLRSIENTYGNPLAHYLIKVLRDKTNEGSPNVFIKILLNFHNQTWILSQDYLIKLSADPIMKWMVFMKRKFAVQCTNRSLAQLVKIIKSNANTSKGILDNLAFIQDNINAMNSVDIIFNKCLNLITESTLAQLIQTKHPLWKSLILIDRAIEIKRGFCLRDTQKLTILSLLTNERSTLAQVNTGEGKSLIVVATAIIKVLNGEKVDIITSSSVLAKRDATDNKDIYELFGIKVSHNCSENIENRKDAYSGSQVMYGDLASFQRDYLLDKFYNKNILGDHNFQNVIVDEVDSMLLDKGNNMLYLSHDLPGFDKLESVYLYIWQWINQPVATTDDIVLSFDRKSIKEAVLDQLYVIIKKEDLKLDASMDEKRRNILWNNLVELGILDNKGKLLLKNFESRLTNLPSNFLAYKQRLCYLLNESLAQERNIHIPNNLKSFVEQHLEAWINNAISAFFMLPGQDYVIDVDRSGSSSDREPNITIIDRDTGTDNANSQWDEALHQFLQIKHGCKLSLQSLKSVFISNVSYFKLYGRLYGLTGTLGSQRERNLLQQIHSVDFVTIPTAKCKEFREECPKVCNNKEDWITEILNMLRYNQRAVLIICESINDVESIKKAFQKRGINTECYIRDFEPFDTTPLKAGQIIIATNLAGRGTDIKISKEVCKAGGLHVCLTYLPNNVRIEEQAFGRAARCGEPGSGQLIILNTKEQCTGIIQLKKERDSDELYRLSEIKSHYESRIITEEYCFKAFKDRFEQLKKLLEENQVPAPAKDIMLQAVLDKWTFWLDKSSNEIQNICDEQSRKAFYNELNKFVDTLNLKVILHETSSWLKWVEGNSTQMIKLGKYFFQAKKNDLALSLFDRVIEMDDSLEPAYYYKALVTASNRESFKSTLQKSNKIFEERIKSTMYAAGIVGKIKKTNNKSILQIEAYENQQKQLASICGIFSQSIENIFGRRMAPDSFVNQDIDENLSEEIYEYLISKNVLTGTKFSYLNFDTVPQTIKNLSSHYGIPSQILKQFISRFQYHTIDPDSFESTLKKEIKLPSREKFWKELMTNNILKNEIRVVIIENEKLPKTVVSLVKREQLVNLNEKYFHRYNMNLYPERMLSKDGYWVFDKSSFIKLIDKENYKLLKKKNILFVNRMANLNATNLKSMNFSYFDSICIEDFTDGLLIPRKDAEEIIQYLSKLDLLVRDRHVYRLNKDYEHIENITLTPFPIYENAVKMLLRTTFTYRIAFQKIERQLNCNEQNKSYHIDLFSKPHRSLFFDLVEEQIIIPSQVAAKLKHQEKIVDKIIEWRSGLNDSRKKDATKYVCRILDESRSLLLSLDVPDPKLKLLTEYSDERNFENYSELSIFSLNALDHILVLEEKKWTWKMLCNTAAVVLIGITQIAIGIAIELFSIGVMTHVGSAFINEGIGDLFFATSAMMSGYFSWNDYAKHKKQSLLLTAGTAGIGAYFSRGVKHSKFGYKLAGPNFEYGKKVSQMSGSELVKTVGTKVIAKEAAKRLTVKAIEGVAIGMANSAVDVLIDKQIQAMCQSIQNDIISEVEEAIENYLSKSVKSSFKYLGAKKAQKMIDDLTKIAMSDKNILDEYLPLFSKITSSIMQGIAGAVQKRNTTTNKWEVPIRAISTTIVWLERSIHLVKIPIITSNLLRNLDEKISLRLEEVRHSNKKKHDTNTREFQKFHKEISDQWKSLMREKTAQILAQHVINPILKDGSNYLMRFVGKSIKKAHRACQESELHKNFADRKFKYQEELQKSNEKKHDESSSTPTKKKITEEYHKDLIKLMKQTRNPEILAAIIRENIPMPLIGVDACTRIIPLITGIKNLKIVVEGDGFRQEFVCGESESNSGIGKGSKPTEIVINLSLKNKHFQICNDSGKPSNDSSSNDCLYEALSRALPDLQLISPEDFRNRIADYIERDPALRHHIEQAWHKLPTNLGAIGGASKRTRSRSTRDLESFSDDKELWFYVDKKNKVIKERYVTEVSAHLRDRFLRFARLVGTLQRISEQTDIDRDNVVQPGASQSQDQTSGLGKENIHASHVLRLGKINKALKNNQEFKEFYNELNNLLGHTQNVPKYANEFHGIGGDFDKIQNNFLQKFNRINFGKKPTTEDIAIVKKFKDECIQAINKRIESEKLSCSQNSELRRVRDFLEKVDTDYIYKKGQEGYSGKYKGPYV